MFSIMYILITILPLLQYSLSLMVVEIVIFLESVSWNSFMQDCRSWPLLTGLLCRLASSSCSTCEAHAIPHVHAVHIGVELIWVGRWHGVIQTLLGPCSFISDYYWNKSTENLVPHSELQLTCLSQSQGSQAAFSSDIQILWESWCCTLYSDRSYDQPVVLVPTEDLLTTSLHHDLAWISSIYSGPCDKRQTILSSHCPLIFLHKLIFWKHNKASQSPSHRTSDHAFMIDFQTSQTFFAFWPSLQWKIWWSKQ